MVKLLVSAGTPHDADVDLVAVGILEDVPVARQPDVQRLDKALGGIVGRLIEAKEFRAKARQSRLLYVRDGVKAGRVLLIGAGKGARWTLDGVREVAARAALAARELGLAKAALVLPPLRASAGDAQAVGQAFAEGVEMALFEFKDYKPTPDEDETPRRLDELRLLESKRPRHAALSRGIEHGTITAEAVNLARALILRPSLDKPPPKLALMAQKAAQEAGVKVRILGLPELKKLGLGALVGVGQGSSEPPRLVVLEYAGKAKPKVLLCGKGITFDSGGISIKPSDNMDRMKYDMAGSATVLAAIISAARLKLPVHVMAVMALAENMPSGSAIRPGDILRAFNGKTIEVLNTDAEGRLVLADALSYGVDQHQPDYVVDVATLTGAARIALGNITTAILGSDDRLVRALIEAGRRTGDDLWQLPLHEGYERQVKGDLADVRNMGHGSAGTIVGAAFLKHFVGDRKWAHLDIAGTCWTEKGPQDLQKDYFQKGPTGIGVRLLVEWMRRLK